MHVGIDLGSRTIKLAAVKNGELVGYTVEESGFDPQAQSLDLIAQFTPRKIIATGYGRHLAQKHS